MTIEGYFTTDVFKYEFSTPEIPMTDVSFTIEVNDIGLTSAKVNVTPSDDKARYFVNVFSMEEYQQWGGDDGAFAAQAAALVDYYVMMGKSLKEIVANLGSVGSVTIPFDDLPIIQNTLHTPSVSMTISLSIHARLYCISRLWR